MEIVKLDEYYLNLIKQKNPFYPEEGIGVKIYENNEFFFVPITSQKKEILNHEAKKFLSLGKNGTLLICDYIYINPFLVNKLKENKTIVSEIQLLQENKNLILKNIRFQINYSKNKQDSVKKEILNEYIKEFIEYNKKQAINYANNAINSMKNLEKLNFTFDEVEKIIEYKVFEKIDLYDVKTIFNLKEAWELLVKTLKEPLTLDYIIKMNELIASHQALKVGDIRDGINSVGGEFSIPIPNKEKIVAYIERILKNKSIKIELKALLIFYKLITEQWFWDGNKRTAFIIANKLLIENGKGIFLLDETNFDKFSSLLHECYKNKENRMVFFKFIQEYCIKTLV
ncbi:MAG: Fic family protein [Fusobacteriaceae bacterium]